MRLAIDPRRLSRALHLDAEPLDADHWRVTGGAAPHIVTRGGQCDCPDFGYRRTLCKHRLAVRLRRGDLAVLRSLREIVRRPKRG